MRATVAKTGGLSAGIHALLHGGGTAHRFRAAAPPLLFGLRLWASVCLALYVVYWLELDNAYWAGTSAAIVCQPQLGASLRKGWFRMVGTIVGAVAIVVLTACFPQDRALFLGGLALWGAACAFTATVLRNFASYAAALSGYTAAIIASDQLGATGGVNGDAFMLAITRASEICIGIVSAGVVLALTDLGGARRRLAALFAQLSDEITSRFADELATAGPDLRDTTPVRRDFIRRVIALDPIIDQAFGESSQLRAHSRVLQNAVDGLFAALAGWRDVAIHLARLPPDRADKSARLIWENVPPELRASFSAGHGQRLLAEPIALYRVCEVGMQRLLALPVTTPLLRLLADRAAELLRGMAQALNGLALLVADPARSLRGSRIGSVRVADWLPAFVNAGRALATIGAVSEFWIVTEWPNGAGAITFAAITVILLAPRADQAQEAAIGFTLGTVITAIAAAIIEFAVLPALHADRFVALAIAMGLVLVPAGAGMAQPWKPGLFIPLTANFVPLLAPANQMNYDTVQFYNQALAILVGTGIGVLAFRLVPPLSPPYRTRRLLALSLRDLRRVAAGRTPGDWQGRLYARLAAMPERATPLQRAYLLAAASVGSDIMRLRDLARRLGIEAGLDATLTALAQGNPGGARADLLLLDGSLASRPANEVEGQAVLRTRAAILAVCEVLGRHETYFSAGVRP